MPFTALPLWNMCTLRPWHVWPAVFNIATRRNSLRPASYVRFQLHAIRPLDNRGIAHCLGPFSGGFWPLFIFVCAKSARYRLHTCARSMAAIVSSWNIPGTSYSTYAIAIGKRVTSPAPGHLFRSANRVADIQMSAGNSTWRLLIGFAQLLVPGKSDDGEGAAPWHVVDRQSKSDHT